MRLHLLLAVVLSLAACHSTPRLRQTVVTTDLVKGEDAPPSVDQSTAPPPTIEVPNAQAAETPPCYPLEIAPPPKRHPRAESRTAQPAPAPPSQPPLANEEPSIKPVAVASLSVLGKKVRGQKGEDLGRVVDILADAQGRVRLAIIESGGFLGVGDRRVAVDWSLLKFHPNNDDTYVMLDAPQRKLQGTPEYRDNAHPVALMAPRDPAFQVNPTQ